MSPDAADCAIIHGEMPYHPGARAPHPHPQPEPRLDEAPLDRESPEHPEPRGCLFALSQPPLMLFLAVIGTLLLLTAVHDLFLL